ncbi:hypothetical protein AGR1B_Lc40009 [Agrobacterium fabacearum S56]|nr:hypothetical protein AGR1B_Lc40009 [Agrobacterium fabacearum S56]
MKERTAVHCTNGPIRSMERGNATGQMAVMACIGCPGDFRTYWFRADAGSFISERR